MAQGNVEVWLGTLLGMSRKSVHHVIRTAHTAVQDQGFNLLEFLSTFPAQVLMCSSIVFYSNRRPLKYGLVMICGPLLAESTFQNVEHRCIHAKILLNPVNEIWGRKQEKMWKETKERLSCIH